MSLPPQANPAAAMAMKNRSSAAGFTTAKPLTNFSGIVAQHVFSIVQSISPSKPAEQFNPSVAKALDSLLHVCLSYSHTLLFLSSLFFCGGLLCV